MGESRYNRTMSEYAAIAAKLQPLKILVYEVNKRLEWELKRSADSGPPLPFLCPFKSGDERIFDEPFPRKISRETRVKTVPRVLARCGRDGAVALASSRSPWRLTADCFRGEHSLTVVHPLGPFRTSACKRCCRRGPPFREVTSVDL
jgi:hypothetical protein